MTDQADPPPVAGLVLAAGAGRRFGMPKALVRHRGRLFVDHAVDTLSTAGCRPVVVVLGAEADRVRAEADLIDAVAVDNPQWSTGMGSSLRTGLTAMTELAGPTEPTAVIILPVDTPGVTAAAVRRIAALASPTALARADYGGEPGHPVLIGREHWVGVAAAAVGDAGAREYLRRHSPVEVPCGDVADGRDIDRREDLR